MAERIYTRAERGRLEPLEEKPFSTEDELQALIAEHPEASRSDRATRGAGSSSAARRESPKLLTRPLVGRLTI